LRHDLEEERAAEQSLKQSNRYATIVEFSDLEEEDV